MARSTATAQIGSRVIIGLPAYNEEKYIGTMVLKVKSFGDVLVVNDGSSDDTVSVAIMAGAIVVSNGRNLGYGATIQRIIREARERSAEVLVIIDADSQHDARDIPKMIKPILEGYDLAIGNRNKKQIPAFRKVGQKLLSTFTNQVSGGDIEDTQSGFRALSRKALESLNLYEDGMSISSEMSAEANRIGLKIIEVPISVSYSKDTSTINPVVQGLNSLARVLVMISNRRPLLFFSGFGTIGFLGGLGVGIKGYQMFLEHEILPVGTILISMLLIIVGILSMFTGVILNAIETRLTR